MLDDFLVSLVERTVFASHLPVDERRGLGFPDLEAPERAQIVLVKLVVSLGGVIDRSDRQAEFCRTGLERFELFANRFVAILELCEVVVVVLSIVAAEKNVLPVLD